MLNLERIENFFNGDKPCPEDIPNCAQLRQEYIDTFERIKTQGGCSPCKIRGIRNHYIQIITNAHGANK
jgi:hypothetical protein